MAYRNAASPREHVLRSVPRPHADRERADHADRTRFPHIIPQHFAIVGLVAAVFLAASALANAYASWYMDAKRGDAQLPAFAVAPPRPLADSSVVQSAK